jgi:hypothetical protein
MKRGCISFFPFEISIGDEMLAVIGVVEPYDSVSHMSWLPGAAMKTFCDSCFRQSSDHFINMSFGIMYCVSGSIPGWKIWTKTHTCKLSREIKKTWAKVKQNSQFSSLIRSRIQQLGAFGDGLPSADPYMLLNCFSTGELVKLVLTAISQIVQAGHLDRAETAEPKFMAVW